MTYVTLDPVWAPGDPLCPPTRRSPRCRGPCPSAAGPWPGPSCPASCGSRREAGPTLSPSGCGGQGAHGERGERWGPPLLPAPLPPVPPKHPGALEDAESTPAAAVSTHGCAGVALHKCSVQALRAPSCLPQALCLSFPSGLCTSLSGPLCVRGAPALSSCTPQPGPGVSGHSSAPHDPRGGQQEILGVRTQGCRGLGCAAVGCAHVCVLQGCVCTCAWGRATGGCVGSGRLPAAPLPCPRSRTAPCLDIYGLADGAALAAPARGTRPRAARVGAPRPRHGRHGTPL